MTTGSAISGVNMESVDRSVEYLLRKKAQKNLRKFWSMIAGMGIAALIAGVVAYYLG